MNKNYLVVKAFVFFGYNYTEPKEFINYICEKTGKEFLKDHLLEKFDDIYERMGCYAVMNYFFAGLDLDLREALVEYACKIYYPKGFCNKDEIEMLAADYESPDDYGNGECPCDEFVTTCKN